MSSPLPLAVASARSVTSTPRSHLHNLSLRWASSSRSPSSSRWMDRQRRDPYVKQRFTNPRPSAFGDEEAGRDRDSRGGFRGSTPPGRQWINKGRSDINHKFPSPRSSLNSQQGPPDSQGTSSSSPDRPYFPGKPWSSSKPPKRILPFDTSAYVSRAAFKLLELDDKLQIFQPQTTLQSEIPKVIDIGAAPGGWTQVVLDRFRLSSRRSFAGNKGGALMSVDLNTLSPSVSMDGGGARAGGGWRPVPGGNFKVITGDFTDAKVQEEIAAALSYLVGVIRRDKSPVTRQEEREEAETAEEETGKPPTPKPTPPPDVAKFDIILSDMLMSTSGTSLADAQASLRLCQSVLAFARTFLRHAPPKVKNLPGAPPPKPVGPIPDPRGGILVMKFLQSPDSEAWYKDELKKWFEVIKHVKPPSSRKISREMYWICWGLREPDEKVLEQVKALRTQQSAPWG